MINFVMLKSFGPRGLKLERFGLVYESACLLAVVASSLFFSFARTSDNGVPHVEFVSHGIMHHE
jgi:hypothetical protein